MEAILFEPFGTLSVLFALHGVLSAVQLDYEPLGQADKIYDKGTEGNLAPEAITATLPVS